MSVTQLNHWYKLILIYTCYIATCFDPYRVILRQNKLHLHSTTLANAYSFLTYVSSSSSSALQPGVGFGLPHIFWGFRNNDCFTGWGCQPHAQPPAILEDQRFLSGLSSLAGWSQFESVRNSLFALAWLSLKNVAQESRRGRACIGLGRNRWHYPSFDSTHPPARCVPSGPHTTYYICTWVKY
jgi:hypothetical protein